MCSNHFLRKGFFNRLFIFILLIGSVDEKMKRAAGFVIFRRINDQIQYLLLKASYGNKHWSPPKGLVDPGENDFETALRETNEEAGYSESDLKIYQDHKMVLNYNVKGEPKEVVYWLAELNDPEKNPILSEEHTEFKFLLKPDAIKISGFKDYAKMLDHFDNKIKEL